MHTVYGIYEGRKRAPLYIGLTGISLEARLSAHVSQGKHIHLNGCKGSPSRLLWASTMYLCAVGKMSLRIRPLHTFDKFWDAIEKERELIGLHKPPLNTNSVAPSLAEKRRLERLRASIAEARELAAKQQRA
jgi:hypothetical protein